MKRLGPDKAYQRALMKRKYWCGPGTSIKWTIEQRVRCHDVLILLCRADYDPKEIAVFTFTWSTLRRKNIPSDKFYYGGKRFAAGILAEHIKTENEYAKNRAMIDAELGSYAEEKFKCCSCGLKYPDSFSATKNTAICRWCSGEEA